MGFWDDDTKDFSAFGIMANTPGPTPDAFLVKNVADQNTYSNPMQNPYGFGNSAYTYTPPDYYNTSTDDIELKGTPTPNPSPFTEQEQIRLLEIKMRIDRIDMAFRLPNIKVIQNGEEQLRKMKIEKEELLKEANEILSRHK